MAKTATSFSRTRFNAVKFGIHTDGPMPCLGAAKCHNLYCAGVHTSLSDGSPCPFETEYARRLEAEFRDHWDLLTITPDVDDFDDLVREHVTIYLQRGRAMNRMNKGWDKRSEDGELQADAYREFELSNLYLDRLWQREQRLLTTLEQGLDRMRERAERLKPYMHVIEALVAGRKAANDAAQTPPQPIWDEFEQVSEPAGSSRNPECR